jgi:hypothetical protein
LIEIKDAEPLDFLEAYVEGFDALERIEASSSVAKANPSLSLPAWELKEALDSLWAIEERSA